MAIKKEYCHKSEIAELGENAHFRRKFRTALGGFHLYYYKNGIKKIIRNPKLHKKSTKMFPLKCIVVIYLSIYLSI